MNIREYRADDLDTCLEIFESNNPTYFRDHERQGFVDWLNDPDRAPYYLFEADGEILACGGIYHDPETDKAGMAWGMVRNDRHGQGIGRAMTRFRIEKAAELYPGLPNTWKRHSTPSSSTRSWAFGSSRSPRTPSARACTATTWCGSRAGGRHDSPPRHIDRTGRRDTNHLKEHRAPPARSRPLQEQSGVDSLQASRPARSRTRAIPMRFVTYVILLGLLLSASTTADPEPIGDDQPLPLAPGSIETNDPRPPASGIAATPDTWPRLVAEDQSITGVLTPVASPDDRPRTFGTGSNELAVVAIENLRIIAHYSSDGGQTFNAGVDALSTSGPDAIDYDIAQVGSTLHLAAIIKDPAGGYSLSYSRSVDLGLTWSLPTPIISNGSAGFPVVPVYRVRIAASAQRSARSGLGRLPSRQQRRLRDRQCRYGTDLDIGHRAGHQRLGTVLLRRGDHLGRRSPGGVLQSLSQRFRSDDLRPQVHRPGPDLRLGPFDRLRRLGPVRPQPPT